MTKYLVLIATAATISLAALTGSSFAESGEPTCTLTGKKLSRAAIKAKATEMGFNVRRVKSENGCYEVYAISKDGSRVEVYMHPTTGKVVKIKTKS